MYIYTYKRINDGIEVAMYTPHRISLLRFLTSFLEIRNNSIPHPVTGIHLVFEKFAKKKTSSSTFLYSIHQSMLVERKPSKSSSIFKFSFAMSLTPSSGNVEE